MEMLRRLSLRNAGIEIVKRTITEEYPEKGYSNQWNNNDARNANDIQLHGTDALNKNNVLNGRIEGESKVDGGNDDDGDDYVVIELLDEEPSDVIDLDENYVDIGMKSSKQILLYPAKKRRIYNRYRTRAVSCSLALKQFSTGRTIMYLKPFFRLTISSTEFWYVMHPCTIFIRPGRRNFQRKPIHYTERVEYHDDLENGKFASKKPDPSGVQLVFSDEKSNEVSKLTLSADFTASYEEKHSSLVEVCREIELSEEENINHGGLRRSYSIEFLNEDKHVDESMSPENVTMRIADDQGKHVYTDSMEEPSQWSFDTSCETPTLKRSFSIEFLNEGESRPLSSEVVHFKMEKGEGVLVYSEVEAMDNSQVSSASEEQAPLKRSYSIEFLNDSDDKRSEFSFETVSNKIEKGEGRLIYDDTYEIQSNHSASWNKRPNDKLKTLGVEMDVQDFATVPLSKQQNAYRIEMLKETDSDAGYDDESEDHMDEEIVPAQLTAEESAMGEDFFAQFEEPAEDDDPYLERRRFDLEILDEKPTLNLDLKGASTPVSKSRHSPKKSPLQTVHIGVEFEKRNQIENEGDELFLNEAEEYLVYEGKSGDNDGQNGIKERHRIPSVKLKTIVVNMDTHHKQKRPSLLQDRRFKLEFQSERERQYHFAHVDKARSPSDSSAGLRTVSIETDAEEVIHDNSELKPPELLKRKAYSVEYLNEMEGDRSVFYEEFVDEGEPRWTLEI